MKYRYYCLTNFWQPFVLLRWYFVWSPSVGGLLPPALTDQLLNWTHRSMSHLWCPTHDNQSLFNKLTISCHLWCFYLMTNQSFYHVQPTMTRVSLINSLSAASMMYIASLYCPTHDNQGLFNKLTDSVDCAIFLSDTWFIVYISLLFNPW